MFTLEILLWDSQKLEYVSHHTCKRKDSSFACKAVRMFDSSLLIDDISFYPASQLITVWASRKQGETAPLRKKTATEHLRSVGALP